MTTRKRTFTDPNHLAAGYDEQEWGPIPTAKHALIGDYEAADGTVVSVRYLEEGPSGNPELEIQFGEDGAKVTVLDEATAIQYLLDVGAASLED